jgi:hypothetical protein
LEVVVYGRYMYFVVVYEILAVNYMTGSRLH